MEGVYKTELCHGFAQGKCRFGSSCRFAHGEEELVSKQQPAASATAVVPPGAWTGAQKTKKTRAAKQPVAARRWSDMDEELELEKEDDVRSMASADTESPVSGATSEADSESVSGSD